MKLNMIFKCYNEFSIAISTIIECFECLYNCKINSKRMGFRGISIKWQKSVKTWENHGLAAETW